MIYFITILTWRHVVSILISRTIELMKLSTHFSEMVAMIQMSIGELRDVAKDSVGSQSLETITKSNRQIQ